MPAGNAQAVTGVDSREAVLCLRCDLLDCDETSPDCLLYSNRFAAQYKYAKTAKGIAITGKKNTAEWYLKNKNNINLKRINKKWVERKLCH